jgi:hypothetical protein
LDAATAAPGSTQAPSSNGTTNQNGAAGQQTPAKAPPAATVVRPAPKPAQKGVNGKQEALGRGPDGKYAKKPGDEEPAREPEPYRFKKRIKTPSGEEDVDYSEDDLLREVQIARHARQQLAAIKKEKAEIAAERARSKEAPHEFLEKAGHDPDKWAAERLAKKAQDGLMSEEERAYRTLQDEVSQLKAEKEQRVQQDQEREAKEMEDKQWAHTEPRLMKAIESANLPRGADVMGRIADVGIEFLDAGVELAPEHVVQIAAERLDRDATRYVLSLPAEALAQKLGPERVKALVNLHIEEFKRGQSRFADDNGAPTRPAPEQSNGKPREFLTSADVERKAREFAASLKR